MSSIYIEYNGSGSYKPEFGLKNVSKLGSTHFHLKLGPIDSPTFNGLIDTLFEILFWDEDLRCITFLNLHSKFINDGFTLISSN